MRNGSNNNLTGIYQIALEGTILTCNKAFANMLGYDSTSELLSKNVLEFYFTPDERAGVIARLLEKKELTNNELRLKHRNGAPVYFIENCSLTIDKTTGNQVIEGVMVDITERKKAEEALSKSEIYLRGILDSTNDGILGIDNNGKVINTNKRFEELWHIPEELIMLKDDQALLTYVLDQLVDPEGFLSKVQELYNSDKTDFDILQFRDGRIFERYSTPLILNQNIVGRVWSFRDVTERKKTDAALKASEEKLRHILSSTADVFYVIDKDYQVILINSAAEKHLELTFGKKVIVGSNILDVFPADQVERIKRNYDLVFTGKKIEYEISKQQNGNPLWNWVSYIPVSGENDIITGAYITIQDITERKIAEEKLKNSEEQLLASIENTPNVAVQWYNRKGEVLFWNHASELIFGWKATEALGKTLDKLIHTPEATAAFLETLKQIEKKRQTIGPAEFSFRHRDGSEGYCVSTIFVIPSADGEPCFVCMDVDITERKKAEDKLKQSEERYRSLIEQAGDAIMITDLKGDFIDVNSSMCKTFGYTSEELFHMNVSAVIDPGQLKTDPVRFDLLANGHSVLRERRMMHKNKTIIEVEANIKMLPDGRVIAIARDIRDRKMAEASLEASEKKLRHVLSSTKDNFYVIDRNYNVILINEAAEQNLEKAWGKPVKLGTNILDVLPEKSDEPIEESFEKVFAGERIEYELYHSRHDLPTWVLVSFTPVSGESGIITGAYVVAKDITERKKAEEAIKSSEEKYRTLVEQAVDAIALYDARGKILDVNAGAVALLGYSSEELKTMSLKQILTEEEIAINPVRYDVLEGGTSTVKQRMMQKKDGSQVETEVRSQQLPDGRFLSVIRDLTERIKAQQQIEKEKELSDSIINSLPGVFYLIDQTGKYLRWNKNLETVTGYSAAEITGMTSNDFISDKDKKIVTETIKNVFEQGFGSVEADAITKGGIKIPYYLTGIAVNYENKPCLLGTGIDITDRKKAEEQIKDSYEQIRRLTEHLQNIREEERTHIAREIHDELGQYLTVLKMDVSWLNKKIGATAGTQVQGKIKDLLEMLDGTVKTVRRISSDLRPSLLDDLGLVAAMEWQLGEFEKRFGIKTNFSNPGENEKLPDEMKTGLFRIFQESLTNVARHADAKKIKIDLLHGDNNIILRISDDGKGFDKQKIAGKKTLGILGMKERAIMIGGIYEISSTLGKGTTVLVTVPFDN